MEEDIMLREGLKKLEQFKWIKLRDNGQFEITDEFGKIFVESYEDCYINEPESERLLNEEELKIISHPQEIDSIWEMYKAGMTEEANTAP